MKCKENKQNENKNVCCPNCNSINVIKRGIRQTENRGKIQRFGCKDCRNRFVINDGFFRMRNTPTKITQSVDLFYRGVSTRKVQEHLVIFHPHNASHMSVYNWVVKYAKMISKFTNRLKLQVGSEAQIDEIEYHRRQHHEKGMKGVDKNFFIDSIDPETKFMLSSEYAKTRNGRDVKAVTKRIKERTENQIQIATTDGWNAYIKTIKNVFGYNNKLGRYNVFHNRVIVSEKDEVFNYPIERLHNSIRARTKVMRGFHGSIKSANAIMKGWEIYYNFITKHQQIKCCPYELAIPELALSLEEEKNKWIALIKLSTQNI